MMRLRDFYCDGCGLVEVDVMVPSLEVVTLPGYCERCNTDTEWRAVINGGIKTRYRVNDWPEDPEFYRGQIKAAGAEAVDSEGQPVRRYHSDTKTVGDRMDSDSRYHNGSDRRETKRDELKHATRRKRGTLPIVCDLGSKDG